jgi:hypothetical protein
MHNYVYGAEAYLRNWKSLRCSSFNLPLNWRELFAVSLAQYEVLRIGISSKAKSLFLF